MIINIFKDNLFEPLKKYNEDIISVCDRHPILPFGVTERQPGESLWWFNPREIQKLHLTTTWKQFEKIIFPEPNPIVYDPKFCLILHVPNYTSVFLTNKLFADKNILIEDLGAGLSQLSFYLTKLGFSNFSLVENFTALAPEFFHDFLESGKVNYVLNKKDTKPIVTNIVGHHPYPKKITRSTELFCVYPKDELLNMFDALDGYRLLCVDSDGLLYAYAREDKFKEFSAKLEEYKVDKPN